MSTLYGYPELGRYGLGHSLLAWARCHIWCQVNQAKMLGPIWFRLRLGPYLRRERDKREYFKLFNNSGYVGEPMRSWLLLAARKYDAESISDGKLSKVTSGRINIVVFRNKVANNFETYFHEIRGFGPELHRALRAITRPTYWPRAYTDSPFIAIHVRLGDFSSFDSVEIANGKHNRRLPIEWYCEALLALRAAMGKNLPAIVFSDGDDNELTPLLSLTNVRRAPTGESITHMLEMARSRAIISTGSGFSLWAAFFGQMPRITYPRQRLVSVNEDPDKEFEYLTGALIPDYFARMILESMR